MSWRSTLLDRLDDFLNPIVVKELRQAVRGRFLAGILIFFLALQVMTLGIFLLTHGISTIDLVGGESYGESVFGVLIGILFFASIVCVPVYAAVRIAGERSGQGMALFFVSSLTPRGIVAGKLAASMTLVLLLYSACLPYLSFTYFLRGIDLPTIFVVLAGGFLVSAAAIQAAIFLASLSVSRLFRILLGLAGLFGLIVLFFISMAFAATSPQMGVGSRLDSWSFWGIALLAMVPLFLAMGLLYAFTAALIAPAASNRARPVRAYATLAWLLAAGGAAFAAVEEQSLQVVAAWLYLAMLLLAASFLPAICARDQMSVRVASEVPRSPIRRVIAFFFFSGSANGMAWSVVMIAATYGLGIWLQSQLTTTPLKRDDLNHLPSMLLAFCAYIFSYAILAALLQRGPLRRRVRLEQTWVIAVTLIAFFSVVPPVVGFLLIPEALENPLDFGMWQILNPFAPLRVPLSDLAIEFSLAWAAVMALLGSRWLGTQVAAFKPGTPADVPANAEQAAEV